MFFRRFTPALILVIVLTVHAAYTIISGFTPSPATTAPPGNARMGDAPGAFGNDDVNLCIPLFKDERKTIEDAAKDAGEPVKKWSRKALLNAANEQREAKKQKSKK